MYDELRKEYEGKELTKKDVAESPTEQLRAWIDDAAAHVPMANYMVLGTSGADGKPSQRVVLLKELDENGLVFFTNYESRKGAEIAANPSASLLFYWMPLHRQVRVEGQIEKISENQSDTYFQSRPRESNLSAMASAQSHAVDTRETLEADVKKLRAKWQGKDLVRPSNWGGYRLNPSDFEFWQGRADRLHDRICYQRAEAGWSLKRIAP